MQLNYLPWQESQWICPRTVPNTSLLKSSTLIYLMWLGSFSQRELRVSECYRRLFPCWIWCNPSLLPIGHLLCWLVWSRWRIVLTRGKKIQIPTVMRLRLQRFVTSTMRWTIPNWVSWNHRHALGMPLPSLPRKSQQIKPRRNAPGATMVSLSTWMTCGFLHQEKQMRPTSSSRKGYSWWPRIHGRTGHSSLQVNDWSSVGRFVGSVHDCFHWIIWHNCWHNLLCGITKLYMGMFNDL